jgi:hypothetical protein
MPLTRKDAVERIERIETLLEQLRVQTALTQEEARVVSESMAESSKRMQGISAFKKKRAELRRGRMRAKDPTPR